MHCLFELIQISIETVDHLFHARMSSIVLVHTGHQCLRSEISGLSDTTNFGTVGHA